MRGRDKSELSSLGSIISVLMVLCLVLLSFSLITGLVKRYKQSPGKNKDRARAAGPEVQGQRKRLGVSARAARNSKVRPGKYRGLTSQMLLTGASPFFASRLYLRLHHLCESSDPRCKRLLRNKYVHFAYSLYLLKHPNASVRARGYKHLKKIRQEYKSLGFLPSVVLSSQTTLERLALSSLADKLYRETTQIKLCQSEKKKPLLAPPRNLFRVVYYPSSVGYLSAYLHTPFRGRKRGGRQKFPAIVWAHQGKSGLSPAIWNDNSAVRALLNKGYVVFVPSWRGEHDNPGVFEYFRGEVNDAIQAVSYVSQLSYVDSSRIYMMGYKEGGTLALLAAQATQRLRAVFSLSGRPLIGMQDIQAAWSQCSSNKRRTKKLSLFHLKQESRMRSGIHTLSAVKAPMFYFAGAKEVKLSPFVLRLNKRSLQKKSPSIQAFNVSKGSYKNYVRPLLQHILTKLRGDFGETFTVNFSQKQLNRISQTMFLGEVTGLWRTLLSKKLSLRWWSGYRLVQLSFANVRLQEKLLVLLRETTDKQLRWVMLRALLLHPERYLRKLAMRELEEPLKSYVARLRKEGVAKAKKGRAFRRAVFSLAYAQTSSHRGVRLWSTGWLKNLREAKKKTQNNSAGSASSRLKKNALSRVELARRVKKMHRIAWQKVKAYQSKKKREKLQRRKYVAAYFLAYYALRKNHLQAKNYVDQVLIQHSDDRVKSGIYWSYMLHGAASQKNSAFRFFERKALENVHKQHNPFYCAIRHAYKKFKSSSFRSQARHAMMAIQNKALFRRTLKRSCSSPEVFYEEVE